MIKKLVSSIKKYVKTKITRLKNSTQKFKETVDEVKSKPRSKFESLSLGFASILSLFGVVLLFPRLPAVAKEIAPSRQKPGQICPAPSPQLTPSDQLTKALSGAAATICGLAVTSGSFAVGAICGLIVVIGILKTQGK